MLDEALAVIRALWSEREATFEGRYYRLDRCPP
jgi:alkanesulfonate monooxygenase SsuD/methylene tetrahydromethanopterin reductase-like flavin-dependent oxidoreductase (luciferase family)